MLIAFSFWGRGLLPDARAKRDTRNLLLRSSAKYRRDHPRIASAMQDGDDGERFFIWRVGDYIISHGLKTQGPCCEVRAAVARVWKRDKRLDCVEDFFKDAVGSVEVIGGDIFPDFFQICVRFRVENKSAHERARRSLLLLLRLEKASSPSTGFTLPLL